MLKPVIALSITVFTLSVFCFPSDAYYVRGCSESHRTIPISHHKEIAENSSASSGERRSAISCLREYGAEGARVLSGLLERDFGNNDVIIYSLNSLGEIRDRSVIIALHDFIKRIDIELGSTRSSSVLTQSHGLTYKEMATEILAKLALSAFDEPSGIHPLTPAGRNDDGTVSIVICLGNAWYTRFASIGIRPRPSDARKIIKYLKKIKNTKPRTQKEASIVKTASEGLEIIEYRIALLKEYGPELIRRETDSKNGWKTTLHIKDIARRIDEVQDTPAYQAAFDALAGEIEIEGELSFASVSSLTNALIDTTYTYRAVYDALAREIEGVLSSESVSSLKNALRDTSDDVRWRAVVLLGHSRHPDAIPAIYKRLRNDPSLQVRLQAAESLGRLAGEKAVPALDEALVNDPAMLHGVISGLGHAGGAGVPVLIEMLENEINNPASESRIAELIVYSLKNTGDRRAIQPLIELITRPADSNTNWASTQKMAAQVLVRFAVHMHYYRTLYYRRSTAEGIAVTPEAHHQVSARDIERILAAVKNAGYEIDELERNFQGLDIERTIAAEIKARNEIDRSNELKRRLFLD